MKPHRAAGIDFISSNGFPFYDQVLAAMLLIDATPERSGTGPVMLDRYFATSRPSRERTALEMTKWFDTSYPRLVAGWSEGLSFKIDTAKLLGELAEALALGIEAHPAMNLERLRLEQTPMLAEFLVTPATRKRYERKVT